MKTYFAPAKRADAADLLHDIEFAGNNPVINGVLQTTSGILLVLNEFRQIIVMNDTFLRMTGIADAGQILGLRPGEAINCIHAHEESGGCGTSRWCSTCGAAVAVVTTLAKEQTEERKCVITVKKDGRNFDLCLAVRSCLIRFNENRYVIVFLQDISTSERRIALERVFLHDINNMLMALQGASELMWLEDEDGMHKLICELQKIISRMSTEVAIQRILSQEEHAEYECIIQDVSVGKILSEMKALFAKQPVANNKGLELPDPVSQLKFRTDPNLLLRILTNMLINAFEETEPNGTVKIWTEETEHSISFCVWNRKEISDSVARRIFQRFFTTKKTPGRGLGTYAMKFFGEQHLGGKVDFSTSKSDGTVFRITLPL